MSKSEVDQAEFKEWLSHPITTKLFEVVKEDGEAIKETILHMDVSTETFLERKISFCQGGLDMCYRILGVTFEELFLNEEENKDDHQEAPYSW